MMLRNKSAIVPFLLALAVVNAQAQDAAPDPNEALQQLLSKAMTLSIQVRVVPEDNNASKDTPIWNAESTKLTIPGRPIHVRLDGDTVRIYLTCTPYLQENGDVVLLAQGQVWYAEPTDKESKYSQAFTTIPVTFGTPVFFYPLGVSAADPQQKGYFNIEVEINIVPYEQKQ